MSNILWHSANEPPRERTQPLLLATKITWRDKDGKNVARNLADSVLSWLLRRRSVLGRDGRETAERCDGDALDGVSDGVGGQYE